MDTLHDWFLSQPKARLRLLVVLALLAIVGVGVLVAFTGNELVMPWVGAVAGAIIYGCGYAWLQNESSDEFYGRVDLKGRVDLLQRRGVVVVFGLLWSALLLYISSVLPDSTRIGFGSLQVAVVIALINIFRARPDEVEYAEALAAQARASAVVDQAAASEEVQVGQFQVEGTLNSHPPEAPTQGAIPPSV